MQTISKEISAKQVRAVKDASVMTASPYTTTSSFADVGEVVDATHADSVAFTVANTGGSNGLSWQILASNDGTNFVVVNASANVAAGANSSYAAAPAPYRYYKAQLKDQSGGSHTTGVVSAIAK